MYSLYVYKSTCKIAQKFTFLTQTKFIGHINWLLNLQKSSKLNILIQLSLMQLMILLSIILMTWKETRVKERARSAWLISKGQKKQVVNNFFVQIFFKIRKRNKKLKYE